MTPARSFGRGLWLAIGAAVTLAPGAVATGASRGPTTVILVRHAEKDTVQVGDVPLSEAGQRRARELARVLGDVGVTAIVTSPYRRAKDTVVPLAERTGVTPEVMGARDTTGLLGRVRGRDRGGVIVLAGHSDSVPQFLAALGVPYERGIREGEYDDLFVVAIPDSGPARLLHLRYGEAPPPWRTAPATPAPVR
jgi:phosphohistidine phosphatase SixA